MVESALLDNIILDETRWSEEKRKRNRKYIPMGNRKTRMNMKD